MTDGGRDTSPPPDARRSVPIEPETAEELMRSRFRAFRDGDVAWLLRTWHPSTRPKTLDLKDDPVWRGLQIVDTVGGGSGDAEGVVEFRATYRTGGGVGILHERSRFVREDGRWFYVDGDVRES
ncbi:YchJ family protein [Microbacterium invictum]|uniref:YchJ family metal-binding protein n=1 Tax=Microbacterium invictum TaxID=515415 RepID=A0ABZ0V8U5_9MICO|nr:YchJ family metal-binding protein [Microbacterium invictum]WQB69227.1 YchJ family metal-binding protein [Microbacterium invictum]